MAFRLNSFSVVAGACSLLAACGGGSDGSDGSNGSNGLNGSNGMNALIATAAEPAGGHCAAGGTVVRVGLDSNGNGTLDLSETTSTQYVCNGQVGATGAAGVAGTNGPAAILQLTAEAAGSNCPYGGTRVDAGVNLDGSATWSSGTTISATSYVCNAATAWTTLTGTMQQAVSNTGYVASSNSQVVIALPVNPSVGDTVAVTGAGVGGWRFAQGAGQSVVVGNGGRVWGDVSWAAVPGTGLAGDGWVAVTSSADGAHIVGAESGAADLDLSSDGGKSWTRVAQPGGYQWGGVAGSASGQYLIGATRGGGVVLSSDYGATWGANIAVGGNGVVYAVAASGDGQRLFAAAYGAVASLSHDGGATWHATDSGTGNWQSAAMSTNGQKIILTEASGVLAYSADGGTTWTKSTTPSTVFSLALSGDGSRIYLAGSSGVFVSTDGASTWIPLNGAPTYLRTVSTSANGQTLVVGDGSGSVYTSLDGGGSWFTQAEGSNGWSASAMSADGQHLYAAQYTGNPFAGRLVSAAGTSVGVNGFLSGGQYTAATLQYIGNGQFLLLASSGTLSGR